jgi:hypothetical protein
MFQNEGPYLKEWLEFHKLVGVQHFYLYDNNIGPNIDNYKEILEPYIKNGEVELIPWHSKPPVNGNWLPIQCAAYRDSIKRFSGKVKWLAFLDIDEFLFPVEKDTLTEFLADYEQFGGVCVNWQIYGTSEIDEIPKDKLMIEELVYKAEEQDPENKRVKSIVRPELVADCRNPHFFLYKTGYFQVSPSKKRFEGPFLFPIDVKKIRINHYWTRTEKYFREFKIERRKKFNNNIELVMQRYRAANKVKDTAILRFVEQLRQRMNINDA